ncbi:hypothetical protein NSQ59_15935 [Margalitia sp. FSL K6-0131]|uniref:hypothetical protein n=1 Tax=Margalitia sp. FSL K6-0131 TaxID=2954604 RepID=UPI0030F7AAAC
MKNKEDWYAVNAFLRDIKNVIKLDAIPTGEFARKEIEGDANKHIIYYEDGVLTTESGTGVKTRYEKGFLEYRMEELFEKLKQTIIECDDCPYELQHLLIKEIKRSIDDYVMEH